MLALKRINPFPAKDSMLLMQFFPRQLVLWARSTTEGYIRVNSSFQRELCRQVRLTRNVYFLDPVLFWASMNSQTLGRMSYSFWQIEKNTFPLTPYDAIQEGKRLIHTWSLGDQGLRINKLPLWYIYTHRIHTHKNSTHLPFLEVAASGSALSPGPPGRRAENSVGMGALDSSSVSSSAGEVLALPADLPLRPGPRSSEQALARRGRAGQLVTNVLLGVWGVTLHTDRC